MSRPVAASLFAGVGGSSLGYKQAGFEVAYANEFEPEIAAAYELAHGIEVDGRSVTDVRGGNILDAVGGHLDVLDGSPPCQGYSTMKMGHDGEQAAERRSFYLDFVRLVGECRPRAFCSENVAGFASGAHRGKYFIPIIAALRGGGYRVAARTLDASRLGVPQKRRRVILIGFRDDLGIDPAAAFPVRQSPMAMGDAEGLAHVARIVKEPKSQGGILARPFRQRKTYTAQLPSPTLCAKGMDAAHFSYIEVETRDGEQRPPSIGELKALAGFPADFPLPEGTTLELAWKMLGNCVPPPMARAWAEGVRDALHGA